jgi:carboxyl-terminal processing protease
VPTISKELTGLWKSRGYGWMLKLGPDSYSLFDVVEDVAVEFESGSADEFQAGFDRVRQVGPNHLSLHVAMEISRYDFDRTPSLPDQVLSLDEPRQTDPVFNFHYFCKLFRRDYAFFQLRGVDWDAACHDAGQHLHSETTDEELFEILAGLIVRLQDNHVMLNNGQQHVISDRTTDLKALMKDELDMPSTSLGQPDSMACISPFINREFLAGSGTIAGNHCIAWGMVAPGVAYLCILRLFGLADNEAGRTASDLPPRRTDHASMLRDDLQAIDQTLDRALTDMASAETMIMDIRINGGGFDRVGMAIANRFADRRRLAFTKQTLHGKQLTPVQEYFVEPEGDIHFAGPVYLLTALRTASAGEIFALCMRSLPQVRLIGESTLGILSDNLKKHLPNGWVCSISNEFYRTAEGELFEASGIPADTEVPVFDADDFTGTYQMAFLTALKLATDHLKNRTSNQVSNL